MQREDIKVKSQHHFHLKYTNNFKGSIMEKFLKFKEEIDLKKLQNSVSDHRVIVLRKSQTTGTIQVKVPEGMTNRNVKRVFGPYSITNKVFVFFAKEF